MTLNFIIHTLQNAAWTSDAFYTAMAWAVGGVAWVLLFLAGIVGYVLDGGKVVELILVAPLWGFICLMLAFILGAGWCIWLGLAALTGCGLLIVFLIGMMRVLVSGGSTIPEGVQGGE